MSDLTPDKRRSLIAEGAQIANTLHTSSTELKPYDIEVAATKLMEIFGTLFLDEGGDTDG